MNDLIKSIFVFSLLLLCSQEVFSQNKVHDRQDRSLANEELVEKLGLNESQITEIKVIEGKFKSKMKDLRSAGKSEITRTEMRKLKTAKKAEINKVLNEEQLSILKEMKAERKAEFKERREKKKAFYEDNKEAIKKTKFAVKAYKDENVRPVLLDERKKFDAHLEAKEIARIDQIRSTLKAYKSKMKGLKAEKRELAKQGHANRKKGPRHYGILTEEDRSFLKVLETKYEAELQEVKENLESQQMNWAREIEQIKKDHLGEDLPSRKRVKKHGAIKFLLLDPDKVSREDRKAHDFNNLHRAQIYPNPASDEQTIEFEVKESGM